MKLSERFPLILLVFIVSLDFSVMIVAFYSSSAKIVEVFIYLYILFYCSMRLMLTLLSLHLGYAHRYKS
jgi:hypothetical protein